MERSVREVLAHYGLRPPIQVRRFEAVRAFSGARLWQVETAGHPYCLRQWPPEHPHREQLEQIHDVLRHAAQHGFARVPVPHATRGGETIVAADHTLWELTDWLPGRACDQDDLSPAHVAAALEALAAFHQAVARYEPIRMAPSPGLAARLRQLRALLDGEALTLLAQVERLPWDEFQIRARPLLARVLQHGPPLADRLAAATESVPLPFCIRDIWREHVLFDGTRATGIIDFGAMRRECRAGDIARLLGSLVGDNTEGWRAGLAAYASVHPLSPAERALIPLFDASAVLLGGVNWIRWIAAERRQFASPAAVLQRMDEHLQRTERGLGSG